MPHLAQARVRLTKGTHEIMIAFDTNGGLGWGIFFCFEVPEGRRKDGSKAVFPKPVAR